MVKNQIIVESVVSQGLGVRATAMKYGVSTAWVSTLVSRFRAEGPSALEPRSKRPHGNKKATPPAIEDRIIELRKELLDIGTDAVAFHDPAHPHPTGLCHPGPEEASEVVLRALRRRPTQRVLAVRHDALAFRRRHAR